MQNVVSRFTLYICIMASIEKIKQLRQETGVSIAECRKALEKANGDIAIAKNVLKDLGKEFAERKKERAVGQGIIDYYIHPNKKVGALLELRCETDFVAKSQDFQNLSHELCLQIAAIDPEISELPLLEQPWIKDSTKTIKDLVEDQIAKSGENIVVKRFTRYEI